MQVRLLASFKLEDGTSKSVSWTEENLMRLTPQEIVQEYRTMLVDGMLTNQAFSVVRDDGSLCIVALNKVVTVELSIRQGTIDLS